MFVSSNLPTCPAPGSTTLFEPSQAPARVGERGHGFRESFLLDERLAWRTGPAHTYGRVRIQAAPCPFATHVGQRILSVKRL